jgi:hypothetical protein
MRIWPLSYIKGLSNMTIAERQKAFQKKLEDLGHVLKLEDDGRVDIFVCDCDYHNGPGCIKCDESWCHHCGHISNERCKGE